MIPFPDQDPNDDPLDALRAEMAPRPGEITQSVHLGNDDDLECGASVLRRLDTQNGDNVTRRWYDNDYRHCKLCKGRRVRYIFGRLRYALKEQVHEPITNTYRTKRLIYTVVKDKQADRIRDDCHKPDYIRLPIDKGGNFMAYHKSYAIADDDLGLPDDDMMQAYVERSTKGRHISGDLGKASRQQRKDAKGMVQIVTRMWLVPDVNARDDLVIQDVKDEMGPPDNTSVQSFQRDLDLFFQRVKQRFLDVGIETRGWRKVKDWIDLETATWN